MPCDWLRSRSLVMVMMMMILPFDRWEMAAMSLTRSLVGLLSYFGLVSLDADVYDYLR